MYEFEISEYTKYYVTEKGEIFSSTNYQGRDGELKKRSPNFNKKRGYLYARTNTKNHILHRLVASAFIPNPENKPCVNHKDGNKLNNNVSNLEWVTHKENMNHAINNGLRVNLKKNEGPIKYTNEQCAEVLNRVDEGMTYKKAGEIFSMPYSTVAHLVRGSRRKI